MENTDFGMGSYYREQRKRNQAQRKKQRDAFASKLEKNGFRFRMHTEAHYTIETERGPVEYWPGTSKWRGAGTKTRTGWKSFLAYARNTR